MSEQETTRCGVVAVIGAPNAGKSTLVNQLVGQKVAITSAKAQTTRTRLMGIALHSGEDAETQMILVDTPGIFAPKRRLDRAMVSAAWEGAEAADATCPPLCTYLPHLSAWTCSASHVPLPRWQ